MTDREIYDSWRLAKNRDKQIGVLSELTLRSKDDIRAVVERMKPLDEKKKVGRPKKNELPNAKYLRQTILERMDVITALTKQMQERVDAMNEEYAETKEWLTAIAS